MKPTKGTLRIWTLAWVAPLLVCACMASAQTVEYIHTDALGTPVAVTDAAKNVIERSEYSPYGGLLNRADNDGPGYTGHVQDAATGLTYMQQRYYDPSLGMFLSTDSASAFSGAVSVFNRYRYANGNPYLFTDPDGRSVVCDGRRCVGVVTNLLDVEIVGSAFTAAYISANIPAIHYNENSEATTSSDGNKPAPGVHSLIGLFPGRLVESQLWTLKQRECLIRS